MEAAELVRKLVEVAPAIIDRNGYPRFPLGARGRCIASTRIGIEVLKAFGVEAIPVPVNTRLINKAYRLAMDKRITWEEARKRGAWLLEVDVGEPQDSLSWPGHLVIGLPQSDTLVDLDLVQFARPLKQIHVPEAVAFDVDKKWWEGKRLTYYALEDGGQLFLERLRDYPPFEVSPDWYDRPRWWRSVRRIVKALGGDPDALKPSDS